VSSSSSAGVEEVNPELHAVRLHAALVVLDVFGVVGVKVAPWLHGGSL
jgi:hypothetical protein